MSPIRGEPPPPGALGEGGCGPAKIMGSGEGKDAHPLGSPPPPADRTSLAAFKEVLPTEGGGAPTLCAPPLLAPLFPNTAQHPKPFACPVRHLSRNSSDLDRRPRFRPSLPNGFVPFASGRTASTAKAAMDHGANNRFGVRPTKPRAREWQALAADLACTRKSRPRRGCPGHSWPKPRPFSLHAARRWRLTFSRMAGPMVRGAQRRSEP